MPETRTSRVSKPRINGRALLLELVVVFVGLLGALQVEQWRETRSYQAAEQRYLERLQAEFEDFADTMVFLTDFIDRNMRGADAVDQALRAGVLLPENRTAFEHGLIHIGHLPSIQAPRATFDEMVSSGALARLRSEELKRALSEFYGLQEMMSQNFPWWREGALRTMDRLSAMVEFQLAEDALDEEAGFPTKRRVIYDFDELLASKQLKAGFFWASDTHHDWERWASDLRELGEDILALVRSDLEARA